MKNNTFESVAMIKWYRAVFIHCTLSHVFWHIFVCSVRFWCFHCQIRMNSLFFQRANKHLIPPQSNTKEDPTIAEILYYVVQWFLWSAILPILRIVFHMFDFAYPIFHSYFPIYFRWMQWSMYYGFDIACDYIRNKKKREFNPNHKPFNDTIKRTKIWIRSE